MSTQLITFKKNIAGTKVVGRGIPIGNHLVVSYAFGSEITFQIFKVHDGKPFISAIFTSLDDTIEIAKWFNESYQEYMDIWKSYPNADIISLSKWSVKNGIKIFELVNEIKHKQVNKSLISQCWEIATRNAKSWMRLNAE
jgi:hypothetical protein